MRPTAPHAMVCVLVSHQGATGAESRQARKQDSTGHLCTPQRAFFADSTQLCSFLHPAGALDRQILKRQEMKCSHRKIDNCKSIRL